MLRFHKIIYGVFLALFMCVSPAFAAIYQKIPGTAIYATPPLGFSPTEGFSGFMNQSNGANILVATMPPASKTMEDLFFNQEKFAEVMQQYDFTLLQKTSNTTRDGYPLTIYQGEQIANNQHFDKWITMLFVDNASYVITLQALKNAQPDETIGLNEKIVMDFLQSITISHNNTAQDQLDALPFSFQIIQPFQFVGSLMNSTAMLSIASLDKQDLISLDIMISLGFENMQGQALDKIMDTYLQSIISVINDVKIIEKAPTLFAGHEALRLLASAKMKGKPVQLILYVTLREDGRPFYMHVTGEKEALLKYQTSIDDIVQSVSFR